MELQKSVVTGHYPASEMPDAELSVKAAVDEVAEWKAVGERIKSLEWNTERLVPAERCFVIRLDGCSFRTFTRGMEKPFDVRVTESMVRTTEDLVVKLHCRTGFCQSDEMSLLFPACDSSKRQLHLYSGRVQKLCSVVASYASVRFNWHIRQFLWDSQFISKFDEGAVFDARIIIPENEEDLLNCFLWRKQFQCARNAIMRIAQSRFTLSQLHGVSTEAAIAMLSRIGISIFDGTFSSYCLYGTFIKRTKLRKQRSGAHPSARVLTSRMSQAGPVDTDYLLARQCDDTVPAP